jgi:hypothetical protein
MLTQRPLEYVRGVADMAGVREVAVGGNEVAQEACHAGVLLGAVPARVRTFARVHARVSLEVRRAPEPLRAVFALKGLVVQSAVCFERCGIRKVERTSRARESLKITAVSHTSFRGNNKHKHCTTCELTNLLGLENVEPAVPANSCPSILDPWSGSVGSSGVSSLSSSDKVASCKSDKEPSGAWAVGSPITVGLPPTEEERGTSWTLLMEEGDSGEREDVTTKVQMSSAIRCAAVQDQICLLDVRVGTEQAKRWTCETELCQGFGLTQPFFPYCYPVGPMMNFFPNSQRYEIRWFSWIGENGHARELRKDGRRVSEEMTQVQRAVEVDYEQDCIRSNLKQQKLRFSLEC